MCCILPVNKKISNYKWPVYILICLNYRLRQTAFNVKLTVEKHYIPYIKLCSTWMACTNPKIYSLTVVKRWMIPQILLFCQKKCPGNIYIPGCIGIRDPRSRILGRKRTTCSSSTSNVKCISVLRFSICAHTSW